MYVLENIHWFALLLGALVFFHELGHFLVAKACGVKVLTFSLGFGPKILHFNHDDTQYQLSLFPLGGYVRMLGELPGVEIPEEDLPRAFSTQPLWQRTAIVLAGPLFNFLLAFVIYAFMFHGPQTFGDTKIGLVSRSEPAWQAGLRPGDKIVAIDGREVKRWIELRDAIATKPGHQISIDYERQGSRHTVVLQTAVRDSENVFKEHQQHGKVGISLQFIKAIVAVLDPASPAAVAGIQNGDLIQKIGQTEIHDWYELKKAIEALTDKDSIGVSILRGDKTLSFQITPAQHPPQLEKGLYTSADTLDRYTGLVSMDVVVHKVEEGTPAQSAGLLAGDRLVMLDLHSAEGKRSSRYIDVWGMDLAAFSGADARHLYTITYQRQDRIAQQEFRLELREEKDDLKNVRKRVVFGARHDGSVLGTYTIEREVGLAEAILRAGRQVGEDAALIGKGLGMLVQGKIGFDAMGGPIMLFVIAEKSAKRGWQEFFRMMGIISVNLGLLNLLPIPMLDGGHLLFFALEGIRRRPPSVRTREYAHIVGLAFILILMVLVFKNDVVKYILD
jgi:regulator of sigma E protease